MERKRLPWKASALSAASCIAASFLGCDQKPVEIPTCAPTGESISHGPIVGGTTSNRANIWLRGCNNSPISVEYKLANDDWEESITTKKIKPNSANDLTISVPIENLNPKSSYEFRIKIEGKLPNVASSGQFDTMPTDGSQNKLMFAMGTDLHMPYYPKTKIIPAMTLQNPDFAFFIGDNVVVDQAKEIPRPHSTKQDYENLYKEAFLQPELQTLRANTTSFMMWDDHEIENDWDRKTAPPYPAARAAYEQYVNSINPESRTEGGVNFLVKAGDVEFYLLDTRSFRSEGETTDDTNKTMLGKEQKDDVKNWLINSEAKFKFLISSVWWNDFSRHMNESWVSYKTERNELFNFIKENEIPGIILISGDEHSTAVSKLQPSGLYEFTPGPMGWALDTPQEDPQILYKHSWKETFGLITTDTTTCPATVKMELKDQGNQTLYSLELTEKDLGSSSC